MDDILDLLLGLFRLIWLFGKGHHAVVLENLALRQQVTVYERKQKAARAGSPGPLVLDRTVPRVEGFGGKPCAWFIRTRWCVDGENVVTPKQPFLQWLHATDQSSVELTLLDLTRDPTIYLIPECDTDDDVVEILRDSCEEIVEEQLAGWYTDESVWPRDRGFDMFCRWFDYQRDSMLVDLSQATAGDVIGGHKRNGKYLC